MGLFSMLVIFFLFKGRKGQLLKGDVLSFIAEHELKKKQRVSVYSRKVVAKKPTKKKTKATAAMSAKNVPHFYSYMMCSMKEMESMSEKLGVTITPVDAIVKAAALSLKEIPNLNSGDTVNILVRSFGGKKEKQCIVEHADLKGVGLISEEIRGAVPTQKKRVSTFAV